MACVVALVISTFGLSPLAAEMSRADLSRVWQQEFAAPPLIGNTPYQAAPRPPQTVQNPFQPHHRNQPHPAVVRVIVPENGATSYGSGTLVDVRDQFGLVITNWHVVRDARGMVEVKFPGGFTSKARALKMDSDWDLAAIVIWRPPVDPVDISATPPQPGDRLTICGYGQGDYRSATGRCTGYYAPRMNMPQQMVELDVEARQGDSGGPIFNDRGELAGVLFGAGQGTTLGSFGGRVETFLATLAPDIGRADEAPLVCSSEPPQPKPQEITNLFPTEPPKPAEPVDDGWRSPAPQVASLWPSTAAEDQDLSPGDSEQKTNAAEQQLSEHWRPAPRLAWMEQAKTVLAAIGLLTIGMLLLKLVC